MHNKQKAYKIIGDKRNMTHEEWLDLRKKSIGGSEIASAIEKCISYIFTTNKYNISRGTKLISDLFHHRGGALKIHVFLTVCYILVVQIRYHKFLNYLISTAILRFQ